MPLGEALRAARESLGLEIEDIAQATRVRGAYIAALEAFELDALPSRPFAIGYLRAYARALGLEPDAVVARFMTEAPVVDDGSARARRPAPRAAPAWDRRRRGDPDRRQPSGLEHRPARSGGHPHIAPSLASHAASLAHRRGPRQARRAAAAAAGSLHAAGLRDTGPRRGGGRSSRAQRSARRFVQNGADLRWSAGLGPGRRHPAGAQGDLADRARRRAARSPSPGSSLPAKPGARPRRRRA